VFLLRLAWTELGNQGPALEFEGAPVRLAPEALRELSRWVDSRLDTIGDPDRKKVGHAGRLSIPSEHGGGLSTERAAADSALAKDNSYRNPGAAAVVEQAGSPTIDDGSERQQGGEE